MPKKKRNSFYFFMVDFKKKLENRGVQCNGGFAEIQHDAGEVWKTMPASERSKYDKMANEYKCGPQARKFTSTGEPIDRVLQRKMEIEEAEKKKRETVINLVCDRNTAVDKVFFVIDVNYYCQTKDIFVINEVSIVAFNIFEGINLVFHKIIDPVRIPLGFTSFAKESEEEHGFKLPPLEIGESNPMVVLSQMVDFIQQQSGDSQGVIPLFSLEERSKAVESFLQQMYGVYEDLNQFALYPLSTLLYAFSQELSTSKDKAMPHESIAQIALRSDKFQYCPSLACNFHKETEMFYNCTKSRAKRWVYTILDYCCPLAGIQPISGDHLPEDVDPAEAYHYRMQREEEREREKRNLREQEASATFSFVDYSNLEQREKSYHDVVPVAAPAPGPKVQDKAWPSLGAPAPKTLIERPQGAWGKSSAAKPQSVSASVVSSTAAPRRAPLRRPGCDAEAAFAQLSLSGADSIGITRGQGRGSVTSMHTNQE